MARRRAAPGRLILFALVIFLGGLAIGAVLARIPRMPPASHESSPAPVPAPSPPTRSGPPTPPEPEILTVDDEFLTAAVRLALGQIGEITREAESAHAERMGTRVLRWRTHHLEVRTRHAPGDAARLLEHTIGRAGLVFTRGSVLTVGVVREGRRLTTHEVRFFPPPAIARVAIIFDDAGGSIEDLAAIIALERPVTIAVLPGLRFSREVAEHSQAAGLEVFLHLPLEADDPTKAMGPGGIAMRMSDEEIAAAVRSGLKAVPGAVGVNNHMGSKGTADERVMRVVLGVVKERRLIWVDSVTSLRTVGTRLAGELGIPTASRQVFLDNEDEPEAIQAQVQRLIDVARRRGQAIAIGHAHRRTAQVLREMLSEFDHAGIEFVPASALAR